MLARSTRRRRKRQRPRPTHAAAHAPQYPAEALADPPGIVAQAVMAGFRVDFVDGSKLLDGPFHYNPGLIERDGDLWLAYRDQNRRSDPGCCSSRIAVCRINGDLLEPGESVVLDLPQHFPRSTLIEQAEDPRLFWHAGAVWMSYVAYDRQGVCAQAIVRLDEGWRVVDEVRTDYGCNWCSAKWQKNWAFFDRHDQDLRMIYSPDPHEVVVFGHGHAALVARERGVQWRWGPARGGTPPVLRDGLYWSFFHSRLLGPWPASQRGRFRYYAGAYAFGARPPHRPEVVSSEPILSASRHDQDRPDLPLVVFPCGAVLRGDEWWVSLGSNDCQVAVARISHDWLRRHVVPVG